MITAVRLVGVDENEDVFVVGLAQELDGAGPVLLFQIPVDADLIDDTPTYCTTDDRHATVYGGVRSVIIDGSELHLTWSTEAAEVLGSNVTSALALQVSESQVEVLRAGLRRVFAYGVAEERPQLNI